MSVESLLIGNYTFTIERENVGTRYIRCLQSYESTSYYPFITAVIVYLSPEEAFEIMREYNVPVDLCIESIRDMYGIFLSRFDKLLVKPSE